MSDASKYKCVPLEQAIKEVIKAVQNPLEKQVKDKNEDNK